MQILKSLVLIVSLALGCGGGKAKKNKDIVDATDVGRATDDAEYEIDTFRYLVTNDSYTETEVLDEQMGTHPILDGGTDIHVEADVDTVELLNAEVIVFDSETETDIETGTQTPVPVTETASENNAEDGPFQISYSLGTDISTVGIVEWSIDEPITGARIQFGRTKGEVEYTAPVDIRKSPFRTLLLGMKPNESYTFVIVAEGTEIFTSKSYEITTGPQRTGLPGRIQMSTPLGDVYEGFTITCSMDMEVGGDGRVFAFIFDREGDYVWWNELPDNMSDCSRARMSFDGNHMWIGNLNVVGTQGALLRVGMDGSDITTYLLPDRHHDFAVLENNHILYFERSHSVSDFGAAMDPADVIVEFDPDNEAKSILYNQNYDFKLEIEEYGAHTNAINYVPYSNEISFSMLFLDAIAVISYPNGTLTRVFGGERSTYHGMSWTRQHNHHVLEDGILVFSNGLGDSSRSLKYAIENNSADLVYDYNNGQSTRILGGAKQLPNGNYIITYSISGQIHETDEQGTELQVTTGLGSIGYSVRRRTLYGAPPPWN